MFSFFNKKKKSCFLYKMFVTVDAREPVGLCVCVSTGMSSVCLWACMRVCVCRHVCVCVCGHVCVCVCVGMYEYLFMFMCEYSYEYRLIRV